MDRNLLKYTLISLLVIFFFSSKHLCIYAQINTSEPEYATFRVKVERVDMGEVKTIYNGQTVYICFQDLLTALGYTYTYKEKHFITHCPNSKREIKLNRDSLIINDTLTVLSDKELIYEDEDIYLAGFLYHKVCLFDADIHFQGLRIHLKDNVPYPKLILRQQELLRQKRMSLTHSNTFLHVDTLPLNLYRLSTLGYSLSGNLGSKTIRNYNAILSANGEFLRGSLNMNYSRNQGLGYSNNQFSLRLDYGIKKKNLKQISLYRQYNTFNMDISGYSNGIYLSNNNKSFLGQRYYHYKGQARPLANIELYNNQSLVAYVSTDSIGHFEADIPVYSGTNLITTVIINGYGETTSEQRTLYIPPEMQAKGKLKYEISSGYTDNRKAFAGAYCAYGITSFLTVTAMSEATLYKKEFKAIFGAGMIFSPSRWFQFTGEYIPTVRYRLSASGDAPNGAGYSLSYVKYKKGQDKIPTFQSSFIRFNIGSPLPFRSFRSSANFEIKKEYYLDYYYYYYAFIFNAYLKSSTLSINLSNYAKNKFRLDRVTISSNLGFDIGKKFYNNLSYSYITKENDHRIQNRLQFRISKRLYGSIQVQYRTKGNNFYCQVGCTYRFPWITVGGNVRYNDKYWMANANVSGGINFYGKGGVYFSNQIKNGATLKVVVYVDKNNNNKYDKEEYIIRNPRIKTRGGADRNYENSGVYFKNISPNQAFSIIIPHQVFDHISWQITPVDTAFYMASYQIHTVYFPVKVVSEITGEIYSITDGKRKGKENIAVGIVDKNGYIYKVYTDEWGIYNYSGLTAGNYKVRILSTRVQVISKKEFEVSIPESDEGDEIIGYDFEIKEQKRN